MAKYFGQAINLLTAPLEELLQRRDVDIDFFMKDFLKKIAFVHANGMFVGAKFLSFDHIVFADSTEGPRAVLTIQQGGSYGTAHDDLHATGRLFHTIWVNRSQGLDLLQSELISKMTKEGTTMTAAEASHDLAFWSSGKRLSFLKKVSIIFLLLIIIIIRFLKKVSDILELKQKNHIEAVEAKSRWLDLLLN